jgi:hypothetical protein
MSELGILAVLGGIVVHGAGWLGCHDSSCSATLQAKTAMLGSLAGRGCARRPPRVAVLTPDALMGISAWGVAR